MKLFGVVGTTLLLLLMGTGISVYAQDQRDDAKPQTQEEDKAKQDEAKPAKPEADKNVKQEEEKKDENGRAQEEKNSKQEESKTVQDNHHMQAADHGRIPDDKFRAHFGSEHTFHIGHPVIVEGRPRFQYGGYSFVMVDPWPAGWAYSDAVYIDFIDGAYYLIDPVHPGIRIVVNVVL
jgi:flagellar motor protein MotB